MVFRRRAFIEELFAKKRPIVVIEARLKAALLLRT